MEQRRRTLSERGQRYFEEECDNYVKQLERKEGELLDLLKSLDLGANKGSNEARSKLHACFKAYEEVFKRFMSFTDSATLETNVISREKYELRYEELSQKYNTCLVGIRVEDARPGSSYRSHASVNSAHVETELAKAQLEHDELIAHLKQRELDVANQIRLSISKLRLRKAEIKSAAGSSRSRQKSSNGSQIDLASCDNFQRTAAFVDSIPLNASQPIYQQMPRETCDELQHRPTAAVVDPITSNKPQSICQQKPNEYFNKCQRTGSHIPGYVDKFHVANSEPTPVPMYKTTDSFAKYLSRKELLTSRITRFNDRPEMFRAWKLTFQSVMTELEAVPAEEMDLLVKWLGNDSGRQAQSIRAAYIHSPDIGVQRIWERLNERFARPESIEASLQSRLKSFKRIGNNERSRLYDLCDIVSEILAVKEDPEFDRLLSYFDTSAGVNSIISKLPQCIQDRWTNEASSYKERLRTPYPPFSFFDEFLRKQARVRNDPSFHYQFESVPKDNATVTRGYMRENVTKKTKTEQRTVGTNEDQRAGTSSIGLCPIHETNHTLNECRAFRSKPISDRRKFLRDNGFCFKCCKSTEHLARACPQKPKCKLCGMEGHPTALHVGASTQGGEQNNDVTPNCISVCEDPTQTSKSCAKIVLVRIYPTGEPLRQRLVYAIIDDQSNRTLASPRFFDAFQENSPESPYFLSTCSGRVATAGRLASGYVIESYDESTKLDLPEILECDCIPEPYNEIPTSLAAKNYSHMEDIAEFIPPIHDVRIELLIGRDLPIVHHVLEQRLGTDEMPYAQRGRLGWVIVGEVCLGQVHKPSVVNVNKTHSLFNGRSSVFPPCQSQLRIDPFLTTENDEKRANSIEDAQFLEIMNAGLVKGSDGHWEAPLPFRRLMPQLPNNRSLALKRASILEKTMKNNTTKRLHMFEFMDNVLKNGHAEVAPAASDRQVWYLPLFGVYHPKKPDKIRVVFDSSAVFRGVSLNSVLLKGPDLANSLLGVLMNFRKEEVAITCDVQQMFYNFKVCEAHRDYLRFIWYKNNDMNLPLIDYRMTVHVFGNSPSPAIATLGLRQAVANASSQVKRFVNDNFYVDDGLASCASTDEAVSLVKETQSALADSGLRLHKLASNKQEVLRSFPAEDLASDIKFLDLKEDCLPHQRSLGLLWDVSRDAFTFEIGDHRKAPFSRRGVLSVLNSIFDPIGFACPVLIKGKLLLREMMEKSVADGWDEPFSSEFAAKWRMWADSLEHLKKTAISRAYSKSSYTKSESKEVHIFSDASKEAVGSVAYLKLIDSEGNCTVGFLLGKAKVAPRHSHTIPRLELCAAVISVDIAELINQYLDIPYEDMKFYTDSRVVLGYINNESRRFQVYVANRVSRIRSVTCPKQWFHVSTELNPADQATRGLTVFQLQDSTWLRGPEFLRTNDRDPQVEVYLLVEPEEDKELKTEARCLTTSCQHQSLVNERFKKFSSWISLQRAIACLLKLADRIKTTDSLCKSEPLERARSRIIKLVQAEHYENDKKYISSLNPRTDEHGIMRVGGRIGTDQKHQPIIIPKGHVATLLIRHYHHLTQHQGRHFTEGAVRSAGYWIVGGKRVVQSVIHGCVTCRRLRGKTEHQFMADLPTDRFTPSPAFSYVGIDTFGPWNVVTRRTRGGQANSKRWAVIFVCQVIRAIHIEVVEELSSESFINALRRFIALRGPVKQFRSDRGSNFVGAVRELGITSHFIEKGPIHEFVARNEGIWLFNPPHASHFGGTWERMIGLARRILDPLFLSNPGKLTHEVLVTFMAEVCSIVNSRPLTSVSSDPEDPSILSPSMLVTQKPVDIPNSLTFDEKDMARSQWKYVQALADRFWLRWKRDYLCTLQTRQKWTATRPNLQVGDIVVLRDSQSIRNSWPLAIIIRTFPSSDGLVRKVELRSKSSLLVRPVKELILLVSKS